MILEFSPTAKKQLKKLSQKDQARVLGRIQELKDNPFIGKKLRGEFRELRSVKVWPFRIIYYYLPADKFLFVDLIQHRQGVYK